MATPSGVAIFCCTVKRKYGIDGCSEKRIKMIMTNMTIGLLGQSSLFETILMVLSLLRS